MRLAHLDLIRYGKFAGKRLDFPRAEHDFHVVMGPNEAGKSTVRQAVSELLFGIAMRSPLGFRHGLKEMRLGGTIENVGGQLTFERAKANKGTLRDSADAVLADAVLLPFLGAADRDFFEQMFGLDHDQLIRGGEGILDASKDIGQILFQSAAGIASLGRVREELAREADGLWGARKSDSRLYYAAHQRFVEAGAQLQAATVRSRAWDDAHKALLAAQERLEQARSSSAAVEVERTQLERVRRLGPYFVRLAQDQAELSAIGEVRVLPEDAQRILADQESVLSAATESSQLRQEDVGRLQLLLQSLPAEDLVLARKADVEALEALRHRYADHEGDLVLRHKEVEDQIDAVRTLAGELAWPQDEEQIRALIPGALALKTLRRLAQERGALRQAAQGAETAVLKKTQELQSLKEEAEGSAKSVIPPHFRVALSAAETALSMQSMRNQVEADIRMDRDAHESTLQGLGRWRQPVDVLAAMDLPATARLAELSGERQHRVTALVSAKERSAEAQDNASDLRQQVEQTSRSGSIVTPEDVQHARAVRDAAWSGIKEGQPVLSRSAELDIAIVHADGLVDRQMLNVEDAAQLQSLRNRLQQAETLCERHVRTVLARESDVSSFDDDWASLAAKSGVPDMHLADLPAWLAKREAALSQAVALTRAQAQFDADEAQDEKARSALANALREIGLDPADSTALSVLVEIAQRHVRAADATEQSQMALERQVKQTQQALDQLTVEQAQAQAAERGWQEEWDITLQETRLDKVATSIQQAEAAVELVGQAADLLSRVDITRAQRIEPMLADLARFKKAADTLAQDVDPDLLSLETPAAVAQALAARLVQAETDRQARRLQEENLRLAQEKQAEALEKVRDARARLRPLLESAGVDTPAELRPLVERSDRHRTLTNRLAESRDYVLANGDGMALDAIQEEVAAVDLTSLPLRLETLRQQAEEGGRQLATLSEERLRAEQAVQAISGAGTAAAAEGRRQEALADMADATERYIKVATAGRLLRWAIDRYRDRKQGPMLARASALFRILTVEGFERLVVDYDEQPPTLGGLRSGGEIVPVSGMSEGTRDQLYMALRLAALELHLGEAAALPFVADDLFINYDDERALAGLRALQVLSTKTQILFLTHHQHYIPLVQEVYGQQCNVIELVR